MIVLELDAIKKADEQGLRDLMDRVLYAHLHPLLKWG